MGRDGKEGKGKGDELFTTFYNLTTAYITTGVIKIAYYYYYYRH